jgi:hypothetical protein
MSTQTITRKLINSPLLAALAYFAIMFIGSWYASREHKHATEVPTIKVSTAIPHQTNQ